VEQCCVTKRPTREARREGGGRARREGEKG